MACSLQLLARRSDVASSATAGCSTAGIALFCVQKPSDVAAATLCSWFSFGWLSIVTAVLRPPAAHNASLGS